MFVIYKVTSIVSASKHTECVSLSNQKYKIQPALINLNLNEYSQELRSSVPVVNLIDVLEIAILLTMYEVEYVLQIKQNI